MNHNFLPNHERQGIKRDYHIRVFIVFLFFLSLAVIVGVGSLFPAYIHARMDEEIHLNDVAALKEKTDAGVFAATTQALSSSTALMSVLTGSIASGPFSTAIANIVSARGDIEISSFSITQADPSKLSLVIGGIAPTRDALLAFKSRLDAIVPGGTVTLPVSELANDTNIQFSIQIVEPIL
jgi:hypothetical protein